MLNNIEPWGLDGLNGIAATFLGAAIVLVGIGIAIGLVRWVGGKATASPDQSRRGLMTMGAGVLGAVVLGSIGGAIQWGSGIGTASLMPEAARPGTITIERKAPKTTCTSKSVRNFDDEDNMLTHAERVEVVQEVSQDGLSVKAGEQVVALKWYPTGTNCSADNLTAANGTEVELRVYDTVAQPDPHEKVRKHTIGG